MDKIDETKSVAEDTEQATTPIFGEAMFTTEQQCFDWLKNMQASQDNASGRQIANREAFENEQEPDNLSDDDTFVPDNMVTEYVLGKQGQLTGGETSLKLKYGGQYGEMIAELHDDMSERDYFTKGKIPALANRFNVEGKTGIYVHYNPFEYTPYGIGMVRTIPLRADELLLDDTSRGYLHEDDKRRAFVKAEEVEVLKRKYKDIGEIASDERYNTTTTGAEKRASVYVLEFEEIHFQHKPEGVYEEKRYYECVIANCNTTLEKPYYIGKRFRIIPAIHTPTESTKAGKEGISGVDIVLPKQENINAIKTWLFKSLKRTLRNKPFFKNVTKAEAAELKNAWSSDEDILWSSQPNADMKEMRNSGLDAALIQYYNMEREAFDTIGGRSNLDRGKVSNEGMAGKLFIAAASAGAVPALVPKSHFEYMLEQRSYVILECIGEKMAKNEAFNIERQIDGKDQKIYFNTPLKDIPEEERVQSPYMVPTENQDGLDIVNDLLKVDFDKIDISVEIKLNILGQEEQEANKAMVSHSANLMTPFDTNKKVWPKEYHQINDNLTAHSEAMGMVRDIVEIEDPKAKNMLIQSIKNVKGLDALARKVLKTGEVVNGAE